MGKLMITDQKKKMLKKFAAAALLTLLAAALFSCKNSSLSSNVTTEETKYILTYKANEFSGYIRGEAEQVLKEAETPSSVTAVSRPGFVFTGWSDGKTEASRTDCSVTEDTVYTAQFKFTGFPELSLTLEAGKTIEHDEYIKSAVSVSKAADTLNFENSGAQIRGRGNASWGMEKKSYKVKFNTPVNLLGIGNAAHRDWVLSAEHCDKSLLRNCFAFMLGSKLDGIEFSCHCSFVHLYVNGEYEGVYMVSEQVEVNSGRVDIDTSGDNADTGFLVELDQYAEGTEGVDYILINNIPYTIKSDIKNQAQMDYLIGYLLKCDSAIREGDREQIESLIDLNSCVDTYILQEFVKNTDVGWSSFYMYIKEGGGKLYYGPGWDFDLSAGNDGRLDKGDFKQLYVGTFRSFDLYQMNEWYICLMQNDWFRALVLDRFNKVKDDISALISDMGAYGDICIDDFEKNFERWNIIKRPKHICQEPRAVMMLKSYKAQLDYLADWYENRLAWLDNYYNNEMKNDEFTGIPEWDGGNDWWR